MLLSVVVAILVAAGIAWVWWPAHSGLARTRMILAMAPGALAEMCITAKVLQLGVPLVTGPM